MPGLPPILRMPCWLKSIKAFSYSAIHERWRRAINLIKTSLCISDEHRCVNRQHAFKLQVFVDIFSPVTTLPICTVNLTSNNWPIYQAAHSQPPSVMSHQGVINQFTCWISEWLWCKFMKVCTHGITERSVLHRSTWVKQTLRDHCLEVKKQNHIPKAQYGP